MNQSRQEQFVRESEVDHRGIRVRTELFYPRISFVQINTSVKFHEYQIQFQLVT